jgi:hypothetical protein
MTLDLQALEANMARTREGRQSAAPSPASLNRKISSSMSAFPNVQFLLWKKDTIYSNSRQFFLRYWDLVEILEIEKYGIVRTDYRYV